MGSVNKTPNMPWRKERLVRSTGWNEKKNVPCIGWNRCFNLCWSRWICVHAMCMCVCECLSLCVYVLANAYMCVWGTFSLIQSVSHRMCACLYLYTYKCISIVYATQFHTVFFLYLLWSYCCCFFLPPSSPPPPLPPTSFLLQYPPSLPLALLLLLLLFHRCSSRLFSL